MTQVTDYQALSDTLGKLLFAGGVTNGLPGADALRQAAADRSLFAEELPGGILLLRRRGEHFRLNFLLAAI